MSVVKAAAQSGRCVLTITAGAGLAGRPLMFSVSSAADGCKVAEDLAVPDASVPPGGGVMATGSGATVGGDTGGGTGAGSTGGGAASGDPTGAGSTGGGAIGGGATGGFMGTGEKLVGGCSCLLCGGNEACAGLGGSGRRRRSGLLRPLPPPIRPLRFSAVAQRAGARSRSAITAR